MVKDSVGYGLTLSGDQPVFVQTVRPGGAAERAGIQENDVILKVNGQRVTEASHTDVVALIQGRTFFGSSQNSWGMLQALQRCGF